MFNRIEKYRKKCIKKAIPITIEQLNKLNWLLSEIGLGYTTFWDDGDTSADNLVIHLLNDTFIIKDYFGANNNEI